MKSKESLTTGGTEDHRDKPTGESGARADTVTCRYTSFCQARSCRASSLNGEGMSSLKEFQCEICGIVSENPIHWFVIECGDQKLAIIKWDLTAATSPTARHFCGEAHAQVYISRWFESVCWPRKPAFKIS